MKLDFVMKLFLALIVVFFIIISVYYTANGLASLFGINFKIKKPGLYSGNLEKLGVKNITNIKVGEAKYSDCLSYCKSNKYEPHMFGNCEDQCSFICNSTPSHKCINVTGTFQVATMGGSVTFGFEKEGVDIDTQSFDNLPELIYIRHTFFLPEKKSWQSDTNLTWKTSEVRGEMSIGKTNAIILLKKGTLCGYDYSCCSKFAETTTKKNNLVINSSHLAYISGSDLSSCKSIEISLLSNCSFPIYINEIEVSSSTETVINEYKIDSNGTKAIECPRKNGDALKLNSNVENCQIDLNATIYKGLQEDNKLDCYNQSKDVNGQTIYFCNCSESGLNTCQS